VLGLIDPLPRHLHVTAVVEDAPSPGILGILGQDALGVDLGLLTQAVLVGPLRQGALLWHGIGRARLALVVLLLSTGDLLALQDVGLGIAGLDQPYSATHRMAAT